MSIWPVAPAVSAPVPLPVGFSEQVVIGSGLSSPVGMAFLPDGRLLIIEQKSGNVKAWASSTGLNTTAVLTVSGLNSAASERGLLGIAVDPKFPARPYIYLYYDHTSAGTDKIRVSRFEVGGSGLNDPASTVLTISNEIVLLQDIPDDASNHNGGTLRFGPDGKLYISIGDDADQCAAQDPEILKGKILRVTVDNVSGAFDAATQRALLDPGDNPYSGDSNLNKRLIWDIGLRNPFRFSIDPANGRLYIGDVGSNNFEEASEGSTPAGHGTAPDNFSWPFFEGTLDRNLNCSGFTKTPNLAPMLDIDHDDYGGLSIVGGPLYRGNPYPNDISGDVSFPLVYDGVYFASEYYNNFLLARQWNTSTTSWDIITFTTELAVSGSDWTVGPDGALWYVSQGKTWTSPPIPGTVRKIAYTGDFDRDGVFDGDDDDDDNDTLTDEAEDLDSDLHPKDTDSDNDGIMDGLDVALSNPDNACSGLGDDASYSTPVDSTDIVCAARKSVTMQSPVEVTASYLLNLLSPTTILMPGFTIHSGARLAVRSVDPAAVP